MTDKKITELTELTDVNDEDLLYIVDDPGVTPVGKKITAANLFKGVGARAYNSGDISINDAAATSLTFDSERWDTDGIHSLIANTGRLTCQTAGVYQIEGIVQFDADATKQRSMYIYLNGATNIAIVNADAISSVATPTRMGISTQYNLGVGEFVELRVYQDSGGVLDIISVANFSPEFMMQRIG